MNEEIRQSIYTILQGLYFLRNRHNVLHTAIDVLETYTPFSSLEGREIANPDPLSEEEVKEILRSMRQFSEQIIQTTAEISTEVDKLYERLKDSN